MKKNLPALYVDAQTKTPAFVFALVALIDFISRWFYQDQINKALQRLTMLTELSGISLPELLTEPVSEETNANVPEPITEDEPVRAYTPELLYIDRPLVFPVPIFIHKHERIISRTVVPELLNHQCIALLFVSMMLPELLRRYVWGTIRPKANADELFWEISDVFTPTVIIESETEQKRQTNLNYSHFKRIITYINPWQQISPDWWNDFKREIRVIGNAFDNPELMKEGANHEYAI